MLPRRWEKRKPDHKIKKRGKSTPEVAFQTRAVMSFEADTTIVPESETSTLVMAFVWPTSDCTALPEIGNGNVQHIHFFSRGILILG